MTDETADHRRPGDDRVADPDIESLLEEDAPTLVPDEERVVPADIDDLLADDPDGAEA